MPGQLKRTACCPVCGVPLAALVDETSDSPAGLRVRRKFYHDKDPQASAKARRPLPHIKVYTDFDLAQRERLALEVRAA